MIEIERKFLVRPDVRLPKSSSNYYQVQGYLPTKKGITVRVRINTSKRERKAFLTIKGPKKGIARLEIERQIELLEAEALLLLCGRTVHKVRHEIPYDGHIWEVDVFQTANKGLVVAEVELSTTTERVNIPPWVGREVSGVKKYSCSNLAKRPYREW